MGPSENIFAAIIPRDEDRDAQMVIPEGFFGNIFFYPTWIPAVRPVEMMNTSVIAHEPEPVRLEPFQTDVEEAYAQRVVAPLADNMLVGIAEGLKDLGLEKGRVAFDDMRVANHVKAELPSWGRGRPRHLAGHPEGQDSGGDRASANGCHDQSGRDRVDHPHDQARSGVGGRR